jgi:omega-amidase
MRTTIIQASLHWEDPAANRAMFGEKMTGLIGQTDLIVLPEMFTTGFSMNARPLAEPMEGDTLAWMRTQAARTGAALVGSFNCIEGDACHNRLVFVQPDGIFFHYDKKHLFALAGEHQHYAAGRERLIVNWRGWRILPLICYDLRFPVWSRNTAADPYDLLLYVANWPQRRVAHWSALLTARAIENQAFTIGVNIAGTDGNGLEYSGDSAILDYGGQALCRITGQAGVFTAQLNKGEQDAYRKTLPFLEDADAFALLPGAPRL